MLLECVVSSKHVTMMPVRSTVLLAYLQRRGRSRKFEEFWTYKEYILSRLSFVMGYLYFRNFLLEVTSSNSAQACYSRPKTP